MSHWVELIITVICAVIASSGFWAFVQSLREKKSVKMKLLMGLAHDRIMSLGKKYIDRGFVTYDEYENLHKYLYKPYSSMGGNGSAKHVMDQVDQLPIRNE